MSRLAPIAAPRAVARHVVVWCACALSAAGCLPDLADDATLAAHVAALQSDGAEADADVGDDADTTSGLDAAQDAVTDASALDTTANDADDGHEDGDAPSDADAIAADTDDGAGNLGASCSGDASCKAPADVAPCQVPICADGTCALTAAVAETPCTAKGLSLAPCEETRCNAAGSCVVVKSSDGKTCDADGDGCTVGDICQSGFCHKGAAKVCPEGSTCAPQKCTSTGPQDAICKPVFAGAGTGCDDGDPCSKNDQCDGGGTCAGEAVECDTSGTCAGVAVCDDGNACTDDVCQAGTCQFLPTSAPCSDGDPCTTEDQCDGKGACGKGVPRLFDVEATKLGNVVLANGFALSGGGTGGGGMVGVGARNGAPWVVRASSLGVFDSAQAEQTSGTFQTGLALDDGGWLAAGIDKSGALDVPIVARYGPSGGQVWSEKLAAESAKGLHVAAVLPTDKANLVQVVMRRPAGSGSESRVRTLDLSQKKWTSAQVTIGSADDPRAIHGGIREPAEKRWILAGRRKVGDNWQGHLYRLNDTLFFGGEVDVGKGSNETFHGVRLAVGGGYVAYGTTDFSTFGQELLWVVRLDASLKVQWEAKTGGDLGAVPYGLATTAWGTIAVAGFTFTGNGASDGAGVVWLLSPNGATLASVLFPAGAGGFAGIAPLSDGYLLMGDKGVGTGRTPRMVRTTPWLQASCADAGGCAALAAKACDDGKPCTLDVCTAGTGCLSSPLAKSSPCGDGKSCDDAAVCK